MFEDLLGKETEKEEQKKDSSSNWFTFDYVLSEETTKKIYDKCIEEIEKIFNRN